MLQRMASEGRHTFMRISGQLLKVMNLYDIYGAGLWTRKLRYSTVRSV